MQLPLKRLVGLAVKTKSGQALGKVTDAIFDAETGRLLSLDVKMHRFVPEILDDHMLIAWSQIVEVTDKVVIVKDGVVPIGARRLAVSTS